MTKYTRGKGTAANKKYQTKMTETSPLAVPEQVSVARAEIVEDVREGLLALVVDALACR